MTRRCAQLVDDWAWEMSASAAIPAARTVTTAMLASGSMIDVLDLRLGDRVWIRVPVGVDGAIVAGVRRWVVGCSCFEAMSRCCARSS
jgi:hypothetical protein